MNIRVKDNEVWGTVYVVLFKIDEIDTVRVFTDADKAIEFCRTIDGYKTLFEETLNRNN